MSRGALGALWMGHWLRERRARLGLSRQSLVRLGQLPPRPLTLAIVQDLERGDRLPSLGRIPALAQGLRLRPWVLSELSWLAPRVEDHWRQLRQLDEPTVLIARAAVDLLGECPARAATGAELALRRSEPTGAQAQRARLIFASALWVLGQRDLAGRLAATVWEQARRPAAGRAALVLAEIAVADARPKAGEDWLARCGPLEEDGVFQGWCLRYELVRAELALAAQRAVLAQRQAASIVDRCRGSRWLRRRSVRCLERSSQALGQTVEVAHWRRVRNEDLLENGAE